MLSFFIDDEELDFKQEDEIGFAYRANLFTFASTKGTRSFELSFPKTPKNQRLFQFADQAAAFRVNKSFSCRAFFRGIMLGEGKLVLMDAAQSFKAYFFPNQASVNFLDAQLMDFDWGDDISLGASSTDVATAAQTNQPDDGYGWPMIYNESFYDGKNEFWRNWINQRDQLLQISSQ